jgi:uncharacterized membrane protein
MRQHYIADSCETRQVTETLQTSAELFAAGIAADNLVVSLYFAVLFTAASELSPAGEDRQGDLKESDAAAASGEADANGSPSALGYLQVGPKRPKILMRSAHHCI